MAPIGVAALDRLVFLPAIEVELDRGLRRDGEPELPNEHDKESDGDGKCDNECEHQRGAARDAGPMNVELRALHKWSVGETGDPNTRQTEVEEEESEEAMIHVADTVCDPWTVMVHFEHAVAAHRAVMRTFWFWLFARFAIATEALTFLWRRLIAKLFEKCSVVSLETQSYVR
jgi:hypothetical protein